LLIDDHKFLLLGIYQIHQRSLHYRIAIKDSDHDPRHHCHTGFIDTTRRHALMLYLDDDRNASRLKCLFDTTRYLCGRGFVSLQTTCKTINYPRQLADTNNAFGG
jgi:hypothetical protein